MTSDASRAPLAVELRGIVKRFPGIVANDGVDFELRPGEVHALLGENGAGKSTLMNIVAGLYRPDEGEMRVDGRPVRFRSPRDAIAAGLGMIHQHFALVPSQTVTENVLLGLDRPRFLLRLGEARRRGGRAGGRCRPEGGSARQGLAALRRGAAARRDPEDALPRRARPDHGRAHGRPGPAGDRGALPHAARDDRQRPLDRLHQPQAGRGAGHRRPRHGHASRPRHGVRHRSGGYLEGRPRSADGGARGARISGADRVPSGRGRALHARCPRRERQGAAGPARRLPRRAGR